MKALLLTIAILRAISILDVEIKSANFHPLFVFVGVFFIIIIFLISLLIAGLVALQWRVEFFLDLYHN